MRIKHFLLFFVLLSAGNLWAQIPSGYYDRAEGKTGQELRAALHEIIKEKYNDVGYSGLWTAYATTDCDANGKIIDIYSKYRWTYGSQQCGSYSAEGDCYNREHTWPQSWFGSGTPKSDLFHIYPTDGKVNGERSSYPYARVNNPTYTSTNGSKLGTSITPGYSGTAFEPIDEYKGDIARSFFYMSTRYYTEDENWSTSAMTNKCEIRPWALTMLLEWHVQDPVSEKEIARNNAVYGYQNNRNPFIDHPEYAEMIWDENWQPGNSYAITAEQSTGGTVSAPSSASEGSTVAITATPNVGYAVSGYNVYKTDSPSTTVSVTSTGTFIMPAYAVTVSASFERNTTYYALTKGYEVNGSISLSATQALAGTTITVSTTPDAGYKLFAIYVYKTGDASINVPVTDNSFVMPAFNVTISATFVEESSAGGTGDFVKVTSAPQDWSGEYLIVYESGSLAFDGSLTKLDAEGNKISVSISNNTIAATDATIAATFTIAKSGTSYTIQSASGYYIGQTGNTNGLNSSETTAYTNNISFGSNGIDIVSSGGAYLRYNNNVDNGTRFRYYKSSSYTSQQAIQLYKREAVAEPVYHTITFENNDGQTYTQEVEEFVPTALIPNTFTLEGFVFDGWNDVNGTYYADCAEVTLLNDLTLYPLWDELFDITLVQPTHGTISASATTATEDTDIELTATPEEGYQFHHWTVTNEAGESIMVSDNTFEMPASDVTVTATFVYVEEPSGDAYYELVTSADRLQAGKTYLIVNTSYSKALSKTQNSNNRAAANVTITDNIITEPGDACELTLGGTTGAWTFYDSNKGGYLYAASSSNNYLLTQTTNDNNGKWSITITTNGSATIKAQGNNTRNQLFYNNSANIFSCYSSGQQPVSLFVRVEPQAITIGDVNHDGAITIADVTALVNIILGKDDDEPHLYNHVAADVNDDSSVTIADVTALVNIILGKNN